MQNSLRKTLILLTLTSTLFSQGLLELKHKESVLTIGGRIQLDSFYLAPDNGSYGAGTIPIESIDKQPHLITNARSSRFWVKTRTPSPYGSLRSIIETDFSGTQGTETNTNSHGLRLRDAHIEIAGWSIGQTDSAFNTYVGADTLLSSIDDTFVRQPLIRYSYENRVWQYTISFEQPETTLIDTDANIITPKDDIIPDIIARTIYFPSWGEVALSVMGRYINQNRAELGDETVLDNKDSAFGWGTNLSGKIKVFELDALQFSYHYGKGMGRYLAYNAYPSGSISTDGKIELHRSFGGNISYSHWWDVKLRSTFNISYTQTKNSSIIVNNLDTINKNAYSTQLNLLWVPIKDSLVGVEYAKAKRKVESAKEGEIETVILVLRYDF